MKRILTKKRNKKETYRRRRNKYKFRKSRKVKVIIGGEELEQGNKVIHKDIFYMSNGRRLYPRFDLTKTEPLRIRLCNIVGRQDKLKIIKKIENFVNTNDKDVANYLYINEYMLKDKEKIINVTHFKTGDEVILLKDEDDTIVEYDKSKHDDIYIIINKTQTNYNKYNIQKKNDDTNPKPDIDAENLRLLFKYEGPPNTTYGIVL
jgi:hypothetical protein